MAKLKNSFEKPEKERMRAEIDRQIAEFLGRGGKIDVLSSNQQKPLSRFLGFLFYAARFRQFERKFLTA